MRLHIILVLIGLLALCALPIDAAGRYSIVGIGVASCATPAGQTSYGVGLEALLRVTCSLDSVLLQMKQYGRANAAEADEDLGDGLPKSRHRARSHQ